MRLHHEPVLRDRAVEYWASPSARRVVDGTSGRAGHSLSLLGDRPEVRLIALDRDPEAAAFVERRLSGFGGRAEVVNASYAELPSLLETRGGPVDGLLLDLGLSSPQLDDPERGFSFRHAGALDLRFDRARGEAAAVWIARVEPEELARVLREYGEVPQAGRVARAIIAARDTAPLETTTQLADVVRALPRRPGEKPEKNLARVFQAVRIAVNGELDELDTILAALPGVLAPGGRAVILSYHSLEDRRVKHAFLEGARDCHCPPELPACACGGGHAWLKILTRKPVTATAEEIERNPRARSVRMRVAERIASRRESS